ncbi:hypothetical protein LVD15_13210 [Fulvivirga maritima]|uniref:hypothetical protein n=1 Tax=Fulvivirga maritima TaxID=2904247 RepID=UPI001F41E3EB|nr:hypothetical protein [Fulvivirga maritima]UII29343.1 hypothetical protein LVD15_13210 [Fulvivirga maritima]
MKKEDINNEVEKTLHSLDGIKKAELSPFFYTRVKARLQNRTEKVSTMQWTWALTAVVILLVLNVFVLIKGEVLSDDDYSNDDIEFLTQEYSVNTFDIYEEEQLEEDE